MAAIVATIHRVEVVPIVALAASPLSNGIGWLRGCDRIFVGVVGWHRGVGCVVGS